MKNVLVPLAEGFEEIEASCIIDVLRRAGMTVVTAGVPASMIKGAHNITFIADKRIEEIKGDVYDAIVLIGGYPGYINLGKSQSVMDIVKKFETDNKIIGAICGAPALLAKMGMLDNRRATIYPGMEKQLPKPRDGSVIVDANVVTSRGPGTAIEFSLKLVEMMIGKYKADEVKRILVC